MTRILSLTLFAISLFLNARGQKSKVHYGIYEGKTENLTPTTWILNDDSSFIFLSFEGNYIKYFDVGKWSEVKPGILNFTFSEMNFPILQNVSYQYKTETIPSFDSVYIKGYLKNADGKGIANASIIFNERHEIGTDQNGYFSITHLRNITYQNLTVVKKIDGFENLTLPLNTNTNYHKLDITLSEIDSTSANIGYGNNILKQPLFYKKYIEIRYFNAPEKKMGYSSILFKSENLNEIIEKLNKAKLSQPRLVSNINQLLRILNK